MEIPPGKSNVRSYAYACKTTVKRATCFGILLQKVLNVVLRVLTPTFKPVLQQFSLMQNALILNTDWTKFRGSHAIQRTWSLAAKQFFLGR